MNIAFLCKYCGQVNRGAEGYAAWKRQVVQREYGQSVMRSGHGG